MVDSPAVQRWLTQTAFLPSSALRRFGGNDVTRLVSAPAGTFFQVVDYKVQQPEAQQAVAVGHWRRLETRKKIERTTQLVLVALAFCEDVKAVFESQATQEKVNSFCLVLLFPSDRTHLISRVVVSLI